MRYIQKAVIICILCFGSGIIYANSESDILQCIDNIICEIENTTPMPVHPAEWEGSWTLEELQRIEYMPQQDSYIYLHTERKLDIVVSGNGSSAVVKYDTYSLNIEDIDSSVIVIENQKAENSIGTKDQVSGKMVLKEGELYLRLHIVGTQDFAVDIFCTSNLCCNLTDVIENTNTASMVNLDPEAPMYNVLGQPVGNDYRGIVIQNGRKYVR